MAEITKWALIALLALNAIGCIAAIGKPREPMTAGSAIAVLLINMAVAAAILTYWGA